MVPEGFQHIAGLGTFPVDWMIKTTDELSSKITKGTTPPKSEIVEKSNIPFLRVNNLSFSGKLNKTSEILFVSKQAHNNFLARSIAYPEDILMNIVGPPLGKIVMLDSTYKECNMNQAIIIYRIASDVVDKFYFFKFLGSELAQQWLQSRSKKTSGQQNLTIQICKELPVPIPPLPEQQKIAKILSTWDKAISTTERLIDNSKQQKKALMQQLLTGKKRFPGFEEEWEHSSIEDISTRIQRKTDETPHPILTISSLSGFVTQEERYSRYMAGESVKKYILLEEGEFAYNKGNSKTYQFGCIFDLQGFKTGLVPHVYVCFKLNDGLSHRYFKYLFEADYLKPQLGALVNTGVRNNGLLNIKPSAFLKTKVPVPSFGEQERIADILHASSEQLQHLEQQLADLNQEKKALMQQLLTGKRRVKVDQMEVA